MLFDFHRVILDHIKLAAILIDLLTERCAANSLLLGRGDNGERAVLRVRSPDDGLHGLTALVRRRS